MNKVKQLLALTGSALIITSFQHISAERDITFNNTLTQPSVIDTVPKRTDTIPKRPTDTTTDKPEMRISDTASMVSPPSSQYVDLRTGQPVDLYYDAKTRRTYSAATNEPVEFYVDMNTRDTIYGRGRYVVNNYIIRSNDGMYKLDASKIKMDKEEIKIKDGTKKFKMDKSNMKMKGADGSKMKTDTTSGKMKSKS